MACGACINRQRKLVAWLCRKGVTRLCEKAKARLAKMENT
jgi:hypothetical protein